MSSWYYDGRSCPICTSCFHPFSASIPSISSPSGRLAPAGGRNSTGKERRGRREKRRARKDAERRNDDGKDDGGDSHGVHKQDSKHEPAGEPILYTAGEPSSDCAHTRHPLQRVQQARGRRTEPLQRFTRSAMAPVSLLLTRERLVLREGRLCANLEFAWPPVCVAVFVFGIR